MTITNSSPAFGSVRLVALVCAVLCWAGFASHVQAQVDHGVTLVKADLIADATAITPGKGFTVGLRLRMAPHWHTYWQYSGDAGLPTTIAWQLPDGFKGRADPVAGAGQDCQSRRHHQLRLQR